MLALGYFFCNIFSSAENYARILCMKYLYSLKFTILYILLIPAVNMLLIHAPFYNFAPNVYYTPASLLIGFIYVFRDFSQRELGKGKVLIPMSIAAALTYALGSPHMATASLIAFAAGELTDWAVYTLTKRPLSRRIFLSGLIAIPVDIVIILIGLKYASPGAMPINAMNMGLMFASNMSSFVLIYFIVKKLEARGMIKPREEVT